jgi:hypothetical protein
MTQPRRPPTAQQRRPAPPRAPSARDGVLARRRMALLGLGAAVPVTLILAIITGSVPLLIVNILVGVALAAYVAMLLSIKQSQQQPAPKRRPTVDEDDMRVVPPRR